MARHQRLIDELLQGDERPADHSLQTKARKRAQQGDTPRTLTAWEWEEWYAEHGVPETHTRGADRSRKSWWRFWR